MNSLGVAVFIVVEGVWVRGDHPGREAKREVREGNTAKLQVLLQGLLQEFALVIDYKAITSL